MKEMTEQEMNNWWHEYYCERGVEGFNDPRDYDHEYEVWREQQEDLFIEKMNSFFENRFDW